MNLKNLMRSYSFWSALAGALVILINSIGNVAGFHIQEDYITDIIMGIAGVLVAFGIVTLPVSTKEKESKDENAQLEQDGDNTDDNFVENEIIIEDDKSDCDKK